MQVARRKRLSVVYSNYAGMAEQVDAYDSKSYGATRGSSILPLGTYNEV